MTGKWTRVYLERLETFDSCDLLKTEILNQMGLQAQHEKVHVLFMLEGGNP